MSDSWFECVANVSAGRDAELVALLRAEVEAACGAGVALLDVHSDADHNRSVFTLAGWGEPLAEAVWRLASAAVAQIDLNHHDGVHRRMGALDVCPFVPLAGASMEAAVVLARGFAARLAAELQVPAFLYARAAMRRERRALGTIRNLGFDGLRELIATDPDFTPDYPALDRPLGLHPTAGATAVGARRFLIAYNVDLDSDDLPLARRIATSIRERDGGLPRVQAMGLPLASRGKVQVSTNLLDFTVTGVRALFDRIQGLAAASGVKVLRSELVGLIPQDALGEDLATHIKLEGFEPGRQVVERVVAHRLGVC